MSASPALKPVLSPVGSCLPAGLYVVKIGSSSQADEAVYDELSAIRARGARILLVAGGAAGIESYYVNAGRAMRSLTLSNGRSARYCPPEEMPFIVRAYEDVTLPLIRRQLESRGLSVHAATAASSGLVSGRAMGPICAQIDGRRAVIRNHRAGVVAAVDSIRLASLLDSHDVVCICPPMADVGGGSPLNVDADTLAAEAAVALDADHVRLVTGTPGLLADPGDLRTRIPDLYPGEGGAHARGRMAQKVRAAEIVLAASAADVAICGPATVAAGSGSRFWRMPAPAGDLGLLSRAVQIPSVSGDERELASFLADWCRERGIDATIDAAGNLVATRGEGPRRLMLLGHLDTVAYRWPVAWQGETLSGRGCVDAKASLVLFLETLAALDPSPGTLVQVVGAVEEESTSAGARFVRDHYPADAVIVGEPSGSGAVTIGYNGLVKLRVTVDHPVGHTAGRDALTAGDQLAAVISKFRDAVGQYAPESLIAVLGVHAVNAGYRQRGEAVIDVRVPPGADPVRIAGLAVQAAPLAEVGLLRATPAARTARSDGLVRAFGRAIQSEGCTPRFLCKKGSCDVNTLSTGWPVTSWVAYGPGDASLDHTPAEQLDAEEYRRAGRVLRHAVLAWLDQASTKEPVGAGTSARHPYRPLPEEKEC